LFRVIRRYSKKQRGYWRRNKKIHWFGLSKEEQIAGLIKHWK
jgi:hypothetical protein